MEQELPIAKPDTLQLMPIAEAKEWYSNFVQFSKSILKKDHDFGIIPGTPKPSLYKPGAEKLRFAYGLGVEFECIDKTIERDPPFIDYSYRCTVRSKQGQIFAQCDGSCNSLESKYGYVWKPANEIPAGVDIATLQSRTSGKKITEFDFAINKAETGGQYGKPKEYWNKWVMDIQDGRAKKISKETKGGKKMDAWEINDTVTVYRVLNYDVMGQKNTIMKMAQKRAFVGAILLATGASEFFTQDIEDFVHGASDSEIYADAEVIDDEVMMLEQWQAQLRECKTPEDVDSFAVKNKDQISGWPNLRALVVKHKNSLKKTA